MSNLERVFDALSSTPRRRILAYISEGPLSVGEIASRFEMSQPAISKHLAILENADLVWQKREGQFIKYGMNTENLSSVLVGFLQQVCPSSRKLKAESADLLKEISNEKDS